MIDWGRFFNTRSRAKWKKIKKKKKTKNGTNTAKSMFDVWMCERVFIHVSPSERNKMQKWKRKQHFVTDDGDDDSNCTMQNLRKHTVFVLMVDFSKPRTASSSKHYMQFANRYIWVMGMCTCVYIYIIVYGVYLCSARHMPFDKIGLMPGIRGAFKQ